jgi:uncharacterized tellurite resistance protein B-like protein
MPGLDPDIDKESAALMTLRAKFKDLVDRVAGEQQPVRNLREEELRLAAAALLVRASVIDGKIDASERSKLKTLLQEHFDLGGEEVRSLLVEAVVREHESIDLYRFTSVLCRELDQDGRKRIVEMLWEVVMADGTVHDFESNLVWRVAELLGVSTRDRVTLRKAVEARASMK